MFPDRIRLGKFVVAKMYVMRVVDVVRLFDAVAGNVMTSNVINKNDATKRQLNSNWLVCTAM